MRFRAVVVETLAALIGLVVIGCTVTGLWVGSIWLLHWLNCGGIASAEATIIAGGFAVIGLFGWTCTVISRATQAAALAAMQRSGLTLGKDEVSSPPETKRSPDVYETDNDPRGNDQAPHRGQHPAPGS